MRLTLLSSVLLAPVLIAPPAAAQPRMPNVEAQREAMKKFEFLVGKWSGDSSVQRGPGEPLKIQQSEDVQFKLDGLLLVVEGVGRNASDGKISFRAFGVISYDDLASQYRFRAYNDGRQVDADIKLAEDGKGFEWGFTTGPARISYGMRLNDKGEWVETGSFRMGDQPARQMLQMTLRREK